MNRLSFDTNFVSGFVSAFVSAFVSGFVSGRAFLTLPKIEEKKHRVCGKI